MDTICNKDTKFTWFTDKDVHDSLLLPIGSTGSTSGFRGTSSTVVSVCARATRVNKLYGWNMN